MESEFLSPLPDKVKKVKIIATLGPASDKEEIITELALTGVDIFRLNLSHSDEDYVTTVVGRIRAVEKKIARPLAILGDLVGPKLRIGTVEPGTKFEVGQKVTIKKRQTYGNSQEFSINFPQLLRDIETNNEIYLGDGEIKLVVESKTDAGLVTRVVVGGPIRDRMGFNAQGIKLSLPVTEKDRNDLTLMKRLQVDALAVSFVQTPKDIQAVINMLPEKNRPLIIAKIETIEAVRNAETILEVSDGMMVARGDLGFSVPLAHLPTIQKDLISLCRRKGKPVITATQMLESMIKNYLPTRAEVSDVANAILDGTDAVMLSAETAIGQFPIETVRMMSQIIRVNENRPVRNELPKEDYIADAVSLSTIQIADQIGAKVIIVFSHSGRTANLIARHRPIQPIYAISPNETTVRKMSFSRGVFPFQSPVLKDFDDILLQAKKVARKNDVVKLKEGEVFVISAGIPFGRSGTTNMVWVNKV